MCFMWGKGELALLSVNIQSTCLYSPRSDTSPLAGEFVPHSSCRWYIMQSIPLVFILGLLVLVVVDKFVVRTLGVSR